MRRCAISCCCSVVLPTCRGPRTRRTGAKGRRIRASSFGNNHRRAEGRRGCGWSDHQGFWERRSATVSPAPTTEGSTANPTHRPTQSGPQRTRPARSQQTSGAGSGPTTSTALSLSASGQERGNDRHWRLRRTFNQVGQSRSDYRVAVARGVLIDQRRPRTRMTHTGHQLLGACSGGRRKCISNMTEIMKAEASVETGQPHRGDQSFQKFPRRRRPPLVPTKIEPAGPQASTLATGMQPGFRASCRQASRPGSGVSPGQYGLLISICSSRPRRSALSSKVRNTSARPRSADARCRASMLCNP